MLATRRAKNPEKHSKEKSVKTILVINTNIKGMNGNDIKGISIVAQESVNRNKRHSTKGQIRVHIIKYGVLSAKSIFALLTLI